jgi:hypothetical protein
MALDIYDELFEAMKAGRNALASSYPWFTHDSSLCKLPKVRKDGLVPHEVSACPPKVLIRLGESGKRIICLHPVSAERCPRSSEYPPFVRLGVSGADLPDRVGLDWSYNWNLARIIREDFPDKPRDDVLLEVARRMGSIAAYDGIPASKLRIWRQGLPNDPAQWPKLDEIMDTEAETFD